MLCCTLVLLFLCKLLSWGGTLFSVLCCTLLFFFFFLVRTLLSWIPGAGVFLLSTDISSKVVVVLVILIDFFKSEKLSSSLCRALHFAWAGLRSHSPSVYYLLFIINFNYFFNCHHKCHKKECFQSLLLDRSWDNKWRKTIVWNLFNLYWRNSKDCWACILFQKVFDVLQGSTVQVGLYLACMKKVIL